MTGHRGKDKGELRVALRHGEDIDVGVERSPFALGRDDHGGGLVGPEYVDLLGHVVGVRADETGRTNDDQRLRREVDVLFVLDRVEPMAL